MHEFCKSLQSKILLTREEVLFLKKQIARKYPEEDNHFRAQKLALEIHKILNRYQKDFEEEEWKRVKLHALKSTILGNKPHMALLDMFHSCLEEKNSKTYSVEKLLPWASHYSGKNLTLENMKQYIQALEEPAVSSTISSDFGREAPVSYPFSDTSLSFRESASTKVQPIEGAFLENVSDVLIETPLQSTLPIAANRISHRKLPEENTAALSVSFSSAVILHEEETGELLQPIAVYRKIKDFLFYNRKSATAFFVLFFFLFSFFGIHLSFSKIHAKDKTALSANKEKASTLSLHPKVNSSLNKHLPLSFRYVEGNFGKLRDYLLEKNSLLAEEPYFTTIIQSAAEFNLNPVILFSITGQEQNFVPKKEKEAFKIANNPFNVFHSWKEYNTDIKDSSEIAARTVVNLCKDLPPTEDPFLWVGKSYAEDKTWGKDVKRIFLQLQKVVRQGDVSTAAQIEVKERR